jgi:hypothetical protein
MTKRTCISCGYEHDFAVCEKCSKLGGCEKIQHACPVCWHRYGRYAITLKKEDYKKQIKSGTITEREGK